MIGPDRCPRCLFPRRVCLCADIPTVTTRTRVVIVRHHLERWRASNSGRLAHLALPNSAIVDHGGHDGPASHGGHRVSGGASSAKRVRIDVVFML